MYNDKIIIAVIVIFLIFGIVFVYIATRTNRGQKNILKAEYHKISHDEAYQIMKETDSYILLDVRTDLEYAERHIAGAVLIPDNEIADKANLELPDKDALILVYCRSGRRSAVVANRLANMGYTKVYNFGGITDWPYDTVSG